jgi:hypothetical protein
MHGTIPTCAALLLLAIPLQAQEAPAGETAASGNLQARAAPDAGEATGKAGNDGKPGDKSLLGISILGNQEAPKALVIVPWKSSQLGDSLGISNSLDDSRQPVDRDVFMRELTYYEIREGEP